MSDKDKKLTTSFGAPVPDNQNAMTAGADFGISAAMGVLLMVCIYVPLTLVNRKSREISYGGGY